MFGRTAAQLVRELTNDDNHIRRFNVCIHAVLAQFQCIVGSPINPLALVPLFFPMPIDFGKGTTEQWTHVMTEVKYFAAIWLRFKCKLEMMIALVRRRRLPSRLRFLMYLSVVFVWRLTYSYLIGVCPFE